MRRVQSLKDVRVALVQMPFAVTSWPSLGLSLLKSGLGQRGIDAKIFYFNAAFARLVGEEDYRRLSLGAPRNSDLLGEWIFSDELWPACAAEGDRYVSEILFGRDPSHRKAMTSEELEGIHQIAQRCRARVAEFLRDCSETVPWNDYTVVGFTSVFQQQLASLALARRLKTAWPDLTIVFGGANCEGDMGRATLDNFAFVDAVCTGEGDVVFPRFVESLAGESRAAAIPGIIARGSSAPEFGTAPAAAPPLVDLDALPYPDFDDFFDQTPAPSGEAWQFRLLFESSRGCWWGEKNHCTFCGLNGQSMKFRYKSADRALAEIGHLKLRYGGHTARLSATDNIIPHRYFQDFLPRIADMGMELDIFYETKANLKKEQLQLYRRAGLTQIQPGIESLQSDVLRLMRKGVSALQNIQLLKWCSEIGIIAIWNYLYGFPGESAASYAAAASRVPRLVHLQPPITFTSLRFDRFSPYVNAPERFAISNMRPYPAYRYVYAGLDPAQVARLAYFFVGAFEGDNAVASYTAALRTAVDRWKTNSGTYLLAHFRGEDFTIVFDGRRDEEVTAFMLRDAFDAVERACDAIVSIDRLKATLQPRYATSQVEEAVGSLVELGLLERELDHVVALSIPLGTAYEPPAAALARLQWLFAAEAEGGADAATMWIDRRHLRELSTSPARG